MSTGPGHELTLEEKVGQLCYSLHYQQPDKVERMVGEGRIGGLYLRWPDFESPAETAQMLNRLQRQAPVPLLVSADFEAGAGQIVPDATALPTLMALGATRSSDLARAHGRVTSVEARAIGVNHVFGPVTDVNVNPANPIINIRSFGGDPEIVSDLARAWIDGCQSAGALACAKHFPGHGDTSLDTHLDLAQVSHDLDRMERVELAPFRAAIKTGIASVMTAHISFPAIDPSGQPATLSRPALTGLLRKKMAFNGLIVTDAMDMHAIARHYDSGDASVRAILAGADLVLTTDPENCFRALHDAVRSGRLSASRLDASVNRVLTAKSQLGLFQQRLVDTERADALCADSEHREVARRIAKAAFTCISGELARPDGAPWLLLVPDHRRDTGTSIVQDTTRLLRKGALPGARLLQISSNPTSQEIEGILGERADAHGATLLTVPMARNYDPSSCAVSDGEIALVERLSAEMPVSVISLGSPYTLPAFRKAAARGCGYGADPATIGVAIDMLAGRLRPNGQLPVEVPGL